MTFNAQCAIQFFPPTRATFSSSFSRFYLFSYDAILFVFAKVLSSFVLISLALNYERNFLAKNCPQYLVKLLLQKNCILHYSIEFFIRYLTSQFWFTGALSRLFSFHFTPLITKKMWNTKYKKQMFYDNHLMRKLIKYIFELCAPLTSHK